MNKVRVYQSFDDLPDQYEKAFNDAATGSGVFSSLPWFRNFESTVLDENTKVRIYCVEPASCAAPALALPMCFQVSTSESGGPRKLIAVANYYTPLFSPISAAPSDCLQKNLDLLAKAIAADRPRWDIVDLHPLSVESSLFDGALRAFRQAGMKAESYFCFGNWHLEVKNRSYSEYFDSLPSKLKNTLIRKSSRLENSGRLRIEIITSEVQLSEAIAAFEAVYNSSWKKPEPYPTFIPGLIRTCAQRGWLRLGLAYVDGEPAAAQLWMVSDGVASIYKLAYDERYSQLSVGSILTSRLMQHVLDIDKVNEVDFLSGDDQYKQDWMSHRRERRGIIAFNLRTARGVLAATRHMGGRILKTLRR